MYGKAQMVRISPKAKRITLQRYLLSKLVFEVEEFELRDLCCLFENQLWLEDKCYKDEEFSQKFGKSLEDLSIILQNLNFRVEFTPKALLKFKHKVKETLFEFLFPRRNFKTVASKYSGLFQFKDAESMGVSKKKLKPVARIGKGYRDKGSARNPAVDGTPGWQEVAAHRGPIYHKGAFHEILQTHQTTKKSKARELLERISKYLEVDPSCLNTDSEETERENIKEKIEKFLRTH